MSMPRTWSRRTTSLRELEPEKIEGAASWDALEWTKVDQVSASRPVPQGLQQLLLEAEFIIVEAFEFGFCEESHILWYTYMLYALCFMPTDNILKKKLSSFSLCIFNLEYLEDKLVKLYFQGHGVVLVNTDEAGNLYVTNFRLLFLSDGSRSVIGLGTIPLAAIEKFSKTGMKLPSVPRQIDKYPSQRLLQVIGKDLRIIVFGFRPRTKQRRDVYGALSRLTRPAKLRDLYAFVVGPSRYSNKRPKGRLLNEYFRLLGLGSDRASSRKIEDGSFTLSNEWWRISKLNSNYTMCPTYPFALLIPNSIRQENLYMMSRYSMLCTFRARCRLPVISWCNPGTGAVLARSSQPLVGLMMNMRSNADEKLVAALWTQLSGVRERRRKLYIADARPRKNALANGAMGGGSESSANYSQSEIVFFGIDNICNARESCSA
ncbi:Myotubularin-like phosphatases II superfamily [Salvia divinorum]|uniref:Myotubularin-like phosphatases II superfamily n=1 Tax=Salvia divinorum TaxID=28513 RepID=A0ABD1HUD5_SALDI